MSNKTPGKDLVVVPGKGRGKGRPREYDREAMLEVFLRYIEEAEIPVIAEFAYKMDVLREQLYQWPEFAYALKKCIAKKEAQLELLGLRGKVNVGMAAFSLKQIGWRDRPADSADEDGVKVVGGLPE